MIQLASKPLPPHIQRTLDDLQAKVNLETNFVKKASKAQSLWISKGGKSGKLAFKAIYETLESMCVYTGLCNYCEQNEASDVEHIYPKSFFPEHTFVWENYLLACKTCNSRYKSDLCYVIDDSSNVIEVHRKSQPQYSFVAFINPRTEDPNLFIILNLKSCTFSLMPNLTQLAIHKSTKTIDILELNTRDTLIHARKSASIFYYQRLELLVRLLNAESIQQIKSYLTPHEEKLDHCLSLVQLKGKLKDSFKSHISNYQHPSVWHSIKKVESKTNEKWRILFNRLPEALTW